VANWPATGPVKPARALTDIHEKISQAGVQYSRANEEQANALQSSAGNMGF
jgi:hypothetical protein